MLSLVSYLDSRSQTRRRSLTSMCVAFPYVHHVKIHFFFSPWGEQCVATWGVDLAPVFSAARFELSQRELSMLFTASSTEGKAADAWQDAKRDRREERHRRKEEIKRKWAQGKRTGRRRQQEERL